MSFVPYQQEQAKAEFGHDIEFREIAKHCFGKILDYGCNNMHLLNYVDWDDYKGTDIILQPDANKELFIPIDKLGKQKFDTIVLSHVLEHLASPINALKSLYENNLNPNGKLLIVVPNLCSTKKCIAVLIGYPLGTDAEHIQGWSYAELKVLASKISKDYYCHVFPKLSKENIMLRIFKVVK